MKRLFYCASLITILLSVARPVSAGNSDTFSADMITRTQGQTIEAKFYAAPQKSRMEAGESIVISRVDRGVAYILMPSQNMYMEQPIDPKMMAQTSKDTGGEIERKSVGTELVNGQKAEKFLITYTEKGDQQTLYQWSGSHGEILKAAATDGSWTVEYRNIQNGLQPESLFEVPAGYQKMEMPQMPDMNSLKQMMDEQESGDGN